MTPHLRNPSEDFGCGQPILALFRNALSWTSFLPVK